jgi:hypothetical protein
VHLHSFVTGSNEMNEIDSGKKDKPVTEMKSAISLDNDSNQIEILKTIIEDNGKQVEWVKNLDFKATEYAIIFTVISICWLATNGINFGSVMLIKWAILIIPLASILILIRNHIRHFKLNRQWQKVVISLKLNERNIYNDAPIVKIVNNELTFHLGRVLYALPILATAYISWQVIDSIYSHSKHELKVEIGECLIRDIEKGELGVVKVIGKNSTEILTVRHLLTDGKLKISNNYEKLQGNSIKNGYLKVTCPVLQETWIPQENLSNDSVTTQSKFNPLSNASEKSIKK